ncbi:MAG: Imm30 family immunity protein [Aggregatilineales bacterium]
MSRHRNLGGYLVQVLIDNRLMQTQEEVDRFLFALDNLGRWKSTHLNPNLLEMLFTVFDDQTTHIPPMQTLVGYVESYDLKLLIKTLFKVTPEMLNQGSWWLEHFCVHLLNTQEHRVIMQLEYAALDDNHRRAVKTLLRRAVAWSDDSPSEFATRHEQIQQIIGTVSNNL